jgi:transposase-like protein
MIHLQSLLDDTKCYEKVRGLRWPEGVHCPHCVSAMVTRQGRDTIQPARQKYRCTTCRRYFDDLTGTMLAGHHQPVRVWVLCLYLMGLNLSNQQIAQELGLNKDDAQGMTSQLRAGIVAAQPTPGLSGEVECDEVYIVAGHKGHPSAVKKRAQGSPAPAQGCSRTRHFGEREAPNLRDGSTRW